MKQGSVSWRRGTLLPSLRNVWMSMSDLMCGKSTSHELRSPLFETLTLLTVYLYKMSCLSFQRQYCTFLRSSLIIVGVRLRVLAIYRNDTPSIFTVWDSSTVSLPGHTDVHGNETANCLPPPPPLLNNN